MDKGCVQNSLKIHSVRAQKEIYIDLYTSCTGTKTAPLSTGYVLQIIFNCYNKCFKKNI